MRIIRAFAVLAVLSLLAGIGVTFITPPTQAEASIVEVHNSKKSDRTLRVYSGKDGKGKVDFLRPGDFDELAWVGSAWVPARCSMDFNGRTYAKKSRGYYVNFYKFYLGKSIRLNC